MPLEPALWVSAATRLDSGPFSASNVIQGVLQERLFVDPTALAECARFKTTSAK